MRTYLDCFPCFLNQALRAARIATDDQKKMKKVLDEVRMMLAVDRSFAKLVKSP